MKSKPKSNNNKISKSSKTIPRTKYKSNNNQKIKSGIDIKNYNSDQNEKIENLQQKENIILIDEINNNEKDIYIQTNVLKEDHKKITKKKLGDKCTSVKEIKVPIRNNYNKLDFKNFLNTQKNIKNKIRINSAVVKKHQKIKNKNNENQKQKVINKILIYINEKDVNELENDINNSLNIFLKIIHIHTQIEYEIINILENFENNKDKKYIYKELFKFLNNFFDQFILFEKNDINFFKKDEMNKLIQKILQLLASYYTILFVNTILLSINDSVTIISIQYEPQFKKISTVLYNIFYNFIYSDLKNNNLFKKDFLDFVDNKLKNLYEKNKYKLNINSNNNNLNELIFTNLNKIIDTCFSQLREIAESMRFSNIAPVAYSIKLLLNSINKKTISSTIDIINNIILYSLLNGNIEIAYQNMLKDKNNDLEICYSRNSVPYLPKISKDKIYTLVLDLDETLIHYFFSKISIKDEPHYGYFSSDDSYGLFNNYLIEEESEREKVDENNYDSIKIGMFLLRPYAKQFLRELNNYYEIEIFTTGTKEYCDRVLQLLDLDNNLIKYRLYKHHIALNDANISVKDLSLLGRDLSKTIIVDNLDGNFRLQPNNGLPIITWKGDINDYSLKYLTIILKNIVINKVQDVRKIIKKIKTQIKSEKNPNYSKVNPNDIF